MCSRACQGPQGATSSSHGGPCRVTDSDGGRFTPKIRGAWAPRGCAIGTPYGTRYGRGHAIRTRDYAIRDARIRHTGRLTGRVGTPHGTRPRVSPAECQLGAAAAEGRRLGRDRSTTPTARSVGRPGTCKRRRVQSALPILLTGNHWQPKVRVLDRCLTKTFGENVHNSKQSLHRYNTDFCSQEHVGKVWYSTVTQRR